MKRYWIAAALAALTATAATAQQQGDWVLARWHDDGYWYPGVIEYRSGNRISVVYDDGTTESLFLSEVRPYDWRIGSRVQCQWNGGDVWYWGRVTSMSSDGVTIGIAYDDGDREITTTAACRSD